MCWLEGPHQDNLDAIRESVRRLHDHNEKHHGDLPYYTPHGPEHCERVERLIQALIPVRKCQKLAQRERFFLLAAAWVHDLGMLQSVSDGVYGTRLEPEEIRKRHHLTSERYIVEHWDELSVAENDKEALGKLSRFHRRAEDITECDESFIVDNDEVRLRLLACYLRLADALDIGASRTPAEPYAVCLAYDIPEDSKFHWMKSRLVSGVSADARKHTITIQFKRPDWSDLEEQGDWESAEAKLDSIMKIVMDDLREELSGVMNVMTRAGFAYYLDVDSREVRVRFDTRMSNDLRELVMNYDTMAAPSSSKLLEIILVAAANILGYALNKDGYPQAFATIPKPQAKKMGVKLDKFVTLIERNILANRSCHVGLSNLVDECRRYAEALHQGAALDDVARAVNTRYAEHNESRRRVRSNAAALFRGELKKLTAEEPIGVLLYGYSELVTKALCGLRDALIADKYEDVRSDLVRGTPIEAEASQRISIYICEGQPKTQTGFRDQLLYHDGSQYALYLKRRGFADISIIPDATAGTIMVRSPIDYVLVGANGIGDSDFVHSAGHYSIVAQANMFRSKPRPTLTILVATSEKVRKGAAEGEIADVVPCDPRTTAPSARFYDVEGCRFASRSDLWENRRNIWMCRDRTLLGTLHDEEVSFLNPREDRVPFDMIDYLILDEGVARVTPDDKYAELEGLLARARKSRRLDVAS